MAVTLDFIPSGAQDAAVNGSQANVSKFGTVGTLTFDRAFPLQPPASARLVTTGYSGLQATQTAVASQGASFTVEVPALPAAGSVHYFASWGGGGNRVGDLRFDDAGHITLRDFNLAKFTSTTTVRPGQRIRCYVKATPGSSTGHTLQVFIGANIYGTSPDIDSGNLTCTGQTTATTVTYLNIGQTPTGTLAVDMQIGRVRLTNDGADPGSGYAGAPGFTVVTATPGAGQVALAWTAAPSQTGVLVYRSTSRTSGFTALAAQPAATAASFTDTTVTNGTTYYYHVIRQNASGYSPTGDAVSAVPAAASSNTLYVDTDLTTAGATAVNPTTETVASALNERDYPDLAGYVQINPGGTYVGQFGTATLPFAAGTVASLQYVLPPGHNHPLTVSLSQGATVIATDVERDAPGSYTLELTAEQVGTITAGTDLRLTVSAAA